MAMSRSFRDNGSDEVRDQVSDICCFCANNNNKIQPASYFCYECGNVGRFLCATCLRSHNSFVGNHDVTHIGSQSSSRYAKKEKQLQKLEGSVKQLLAEEEVMKSQLDKAITDRDEKQLLAKALEKQLEDLYSQNANESSRTKALLEKHAQEIKKSEEECVRLGKLIDEKNEALQKFDDEVKRLMNEITMMKSQLVKSKAARDETQTMMNDLVKMLAKTNSENERMASQIRKFDYLTWKKYSDVIDERDELNTREQQQQQVSCGMDKSEKLVVAAIDVGTTFSGYAFSFKHQYQADPSKIHLNSVWVAGTMALLSLKAPTVVLFDENKTFHSFGYEAENTYAELAEDNEHHKWYYFRRFKMRIHDKTITRDTGIDDDKGRKMKAIDVFGAVIKYLKDHLLNLLRTKGTEVQNQDIHWVLTVPAICNYSAKQFMREAAYKAGIDGLNLSIVSEPEAASLYCQIVSTDKINGHEAAKRALATPGTKYMVINFGDNADITVHERQADGGLRELHKTSIDNLIGTKVNEEFYGLLISIIGGKVYQKFVDENKADYLDLQREFETKKRTITPQSNGKIIIKMPVAIATIYEDEMEGSIKGAIEGSPYSGKITWSNDKMRIDAQIFKHLFKSCSDKIVLRIKDLLKQPHVQGTNIFLMVGGVSESAMVQDAIMKSLPYGKFIIPKEAGLAVLKGAVIFGRRPVAITSRVFIYTYGINIFPAFDPTIHPEDHRVSVGGIDRCRDVFKKYIHKGETVPVGEARTIKHVTLKSNQKKMVLKIFASPKKDPMFVDEEDTQYLGKLVVNLPDSEKKIRVEVKMMFGETELTVEAMEMSQKTNMELTLGTFDTSLYQTSFNLYKLIFSIKQQHLDFIHELLSIHVCSSVTPKIK